MDTYQRKREEILCPVCDVPVELSVNLYTDEQNRIVHKTCYTQKIVPTVKSPLSRFYGESKFDCFA